MRRKAPLFEHTRSSSGATFDQRPWSPELRVFHDAQDLWLRRKTPLFALYRVRRIPLRLILEAFPSPSSSSAIDFHVLTLSLFRKHATPGQALQPFPLSTDLDLRRLLLGASTSNYLRTWASRHSPLGHYHPADDTSRPRPATTSPGILDVELL